MVIIANMNMLNLKISRWRAAFTLVEILSAVAILSAVTALAIVSVRNFSEGTENSKLRSDVLVLNNAIRTRMISGGAFATGDLAGPAAIIAKLKQRATTASAKQLAGQRGSLVDKRLTFRTQTFAEAASSADRATADNRTRHGESAWHGRCERSCSPSHADALSPALPAPRAGRTGCLAAW